jgi:class 3 adenylate cyclase
MPSKDKRKLAAIMFADVVGYSRMMASNEERTLELLKDFENICSPIISDSEGEIIKKVGDELFCEFSSAKQAVDCALSIQKSIQPYNDSRPKDFKLQVRIGIHIGDIVIREGDVFGDGVNVASRIQPFASPGGICISSAVKEVVSSHPNYNIISEGQQELKNIIEKHTLYRIETGCEDEIIHVKKSTIYKKRTYIITAVVLLLVIIGYNGFKYYKIYSDLKLLMTNTIDIGEEYNVLLDKIFTGEKVFILGNMIKTFSPVNILSNNTLYSSPMSIVLVISNFKSE